jgi:hypothetical protein
MTKEWHVNVIGTAPISDNAFTYVDPDVGSSTFEISVVRADYEHGKQSLGWSGPKKAIVAQGTPLPPRWLWDEYLRLARELAGKLAGSEYLPN